MKLIINYFTINLKYQNGRLYQVEKIAKKGKDDEKLTLLKGGSFEECKEYLLSMYKGEIKDE